MLFRSESALQQSEMNQERRNHSSPGAPLRVATVTNKQPTTNNNGGFEMDMSDDGDQFVKY